MGENRNKQLKKLQECSFNEVKEIYKELRNIEKCRIIEKLIEVDCGYEIMDMLFKRNVSKKSWKITGNGNYHYTSNNTIYEYNLTNWKWINVKFENILITISLQPYDTDKKTGNTHTLFDRIGIIAKHSSQLASISFITDIDLPMDSNKLDKLIEILNKVISAIKILETDM